MSPKKIKKLTDKKYRAETGLFLVEGEKNILELLQSDFVIEALLCTKQFLQVYQHEIDAYGSRLGFEPLSYDIADEKTLVQNGTLLSNNAGIAVVQQKAETDLETIISDAQDNIVIVLDDIRDPGNMGTILRTADWYGVTHIVASPTTTDFYNPKVIGATMGSFTRMSVTYSDLPHLLENAQTLHIPIITADLEGASSHTTKLPTHGFLIVGSESHGVSSESVSYASHRVMIPRFGSAESLNVSIATGILLDTMRRGF